MSGNGKRFTLDQMLANAERIRTFCALNGSDVNEQLLADSEKLLELAKFIHKVAPKFFFEDLPQNGFITFLRISTAYTSRITSQMDEKNKVDPDLLGLFRLLFDSAAWLIDLVDDLERERSNDQHFIKRQFCLQSKHPFNLVNTNYDVQPAKLSTYIGFWLDDERMRKGFFFFYKMLTAVFSFPWSLAALWSPERFGWYVKQLIANISLRFPFSLIHTMAENPFAAGLTAVLVNRGVPVTSKTLQLPRQNRFRLDCRGAILDFHRMTDEEVAAYANDQHEQQRQSAPGMRHRNHETISCRLWSIAGMERIVESVERIRNRTKPAPKKLKHYTASRSPQSDATGNGATTEINNNTVPSDSNLSDYYRTANPEKKLILFLHGGGFFCLKSRSYEIYLKKLVNQLAGVPMLAVDYSLTVPYPIALQEVTDVYLWLLSSQDEVKQKLGFHPKKIILAGDSSGGFLAITLTIVLNELNKMLSKSAAAAGTNRQTNRQTPVLLPAIHSIQLPTSLVLAYPAFTISGLSASLCTGTFELVVEAHTLMLVISMYGANVATVGDFKRIENDERFQRIVAKNRGKFNEKSSESARGQIVSTTDESPWFRCSYPEYVNYAEYIGESYKHPFVNPHLYEDRFHELKGVELYVVTGNTDFLLDHSIELARIWKGGKVCLDVFDGLLHGFLQFTVVSDESSEAFEIVTERFQQACGLI